METKIEFVSYKKLIIFGSEGAGKTSLTSRLESGSFKEESPSTDCKIFFLNIYYNKYSLCLKKNFCEMCRRKNIGFKYIRNKIR